MPHSLTKLWIHLILGTKNRDNLINQEIFSKLKNYIKQNLQEQECVVRIINGTKNHLHILLLQSPKKSLSEIIKNIKGSSSHWINQQNLVNYKFSWQIGYGAFSVSESNVESVVKYIQNQKEHHEKLSYQQELDLFLDKHGLVG